MKVKIFFVLQLMLSTLIVLVIFLLNVKKIRKANYLFVNSEGFGHSVVDSMLFIEMYGPKSLVISLGTHFNQNPGVQRNKFFDKCLKNNLLGLYFSSRFLTMQNWKYVHSIAKRLLKLFCYLLNKKNISIYESCRKVAELSMPQKLSLYFKMSTNEASSIVESVIENFKQADNRHHAASYLSFLLQNSSINTDSVYKGLSRHLRSLIENLLANKQIVCLAVRRGENLWHSNADYYLKAIDAIYSEGFSVVLIGDRKYLLELAKERNYSLEDKIANYNVTVKEQKALELFAIQKCLFVVGDQGGIWSIVSVFNKPGLLINATPTGQLQYNVESLPRRWVCASTRVEMTDVNKIFGDLFFKWTSNSKISKTPESQTIKNSDSEAISNLICIENDTDFVISVIKRYMKNYVYQSPNEMQDIVKINFPENNFFKLAKKSSYSEEYINQLTGWKIT